MTIDTLSVCVCVWESILNLFSVYAQLTRNKYQLGVGMTVMAKVITSAEICENAKMARDMALAGESMHEFTAFLWHIWRNDTEIK